MKKFSELDVVGQNSVIHSRVADLMGKFISAFETDWNEIPRDIMDELSSLHANKHDSATVPYTENARQRVLRRTTHKVYEYCKQELEKDGHTSFNEDRYSQPFDLEGYMKTIAMQDPKIYTESKGD